MVPLTSSPFFSSRHSHLERWSGVSTSAAIQFWPKSYFAGGKPCFLLATLENLPFSNESESSTRRSPAFSESLSGVSVTTHFDPSKGGVGLLSDWPTHNAAVAAMQDNESARCAMVIDRSSNEVSRDLAPVARPPQG